jgi:hypothetical protein
MLSKCANPVCSETFRYLHQGKIFHLTPTPAMQMAAEAKGLMTERFWLCDACAKELTVIWDGTQAKVVPLPEEPRISKSRLAEPAGTPTLNLAAEDTPHRGSLHGGPRAAFAGRRPR